MRERFEQWGAGLSEEDFACALAAFGVLGGGRVPRRKKGAFNWRFDPWLFRTSAADLAKTWRSFRAVVRGPVSIRLNPVELDHAGVNPSWLRIRLLRGSGAIILFESAGRAERFDPRSKSYSIMDEEVLKRSVPPEDSKVKPLDPPPPGSSSVPTPRFLQARISDETEPDHPQEVQSALRAGRTYRAKVRIGLPDRAWISVEELFPDEELPEQDGHWLTVVFWGPRLGPQPQVERLWLPPRGNSQEAGFPFQVPEGVGVVAARITVLHANRVLQTGVLRATVGLRRPWTFRLDATPRTRLEGLSNRSEFDVALVLNHDDEGTARGTAISGDQAVPINLTESSVDALTRALGDQISKIAANPKRYESLQSEGTEELLRTLAQHGGGLYRQLSGYNPLAKLDQAEAEGRQARLHLTSARPDSFFPVELVYRYDVPEDTARICEHVPTALAEGSCPASCPSDKSETVCPLGFWGLCRVIERHSYQVQPERFADGFRLQPEPVLPESLLDVSGKALLAASDVASKYEAGAVESLLLKLRQRGPAELARSWLEWSERVKTDRPTLLVLLPHHERREGFEILEIGAADALKSVLVKKKHVRTEDEDRPIVLLMGCDTNLARIAFENFVASFMLQGAAIVVSTIATILGRHASPATAHLIELLDEEALEGGSTFGEVMMRLRRKLLVTETPMALGLTAYGDADWTLTRKADALHRDAPRPQR